MEKILVTGVLGNVGREVFKYLQQYSDPNTEIIVADYDEKKVRNEFGKEINFRKLDYYDPSSFLSCTQGITKLFLMRPPAIANIRKLMAPFIKQAKNAGVKHIVFLSIIGVNPLVPHWHVEKYIKRYKIPFTMLRCGFFMQNLNTTHQAVIQKEHDLLIPAGNGKTAFIDARDIGETAAIVLTKDKYINQTPNLTGSLALDYYEVAKKMTNILGFPVKYSEPSPKVFNKKMLTYGFDQKFLRIVKLLYWNVRAGHAKDVYIDLTQILNRNPRTMDEYINEYRNYWT
ncbi:NmrA family NAD(P)-binding protein [Candidatus Lokiarchaeum ossiferum]|uniref:NmrA family NAD(P)-binding protein n=1 Tax=Candidatus Lokiarchaeum ossiferum TaxID=2951803 RepID=UPI00352D68BE